MVSTCSRNFHAHAQLHQENIFFIVTHMGDAEKGIQQNTRCLGLVEKRVDLKVRTERIRSLRLTENQGNLQSKWSGHLGNHLLWIWKLFAVSDHALAASYHDILGDFSHFFKFRIFTTFNNLQLLAASIRGPRILSFQSNFVIGLVFSLVHCMISNSCPLIPKFDKNI